MKRELFKAKRISGELVDYFLRHGFRKLCLTIEIEAEETVIVMSGDILQETHEIDYLYDELNAPRMPEYDDYYDELLGVDHEESLAIVAYMTDSAEVDWIDNMFQVTLIRKHV